MYEVLLWEMDSFSGRKLDTTKIFKTKEEALVFVNDFNAENNQNTVPDWYMYAELSE